MPIRHTWDLALAFLIAAAPMLSMAMSSVAMSSVAMAADIPSLSGLGGEKLTGAALEEGETILVIWASWSPRCQDIARRVNSLARHWSPRARVATVVFQEDAEIVREFLADQKLDVPVYLDLTGSFSKRFAVTTLPGLLVVKDGQAGFQGKLPLNPNPVIERALGKKPSLGKKP